MLFLRWSASCISWLTLLYLWLNLNSIHYTTKGELNSVLWTSNTPSLLKPMEPELNTLSSLLVSRLSGQELVDSALIPLSDIHSCTH